MKNTLVASLLLFVSCFWTNLAAELHIFLVGSGVVGAELLTQIRENHPEMSVVAIANSKKMLLQKEGIALSDWRTSLDASQEAMDWSNFLQQMLDLKLEQSVLVDCTSNQNISDSYPAILSNGISIVTPNKRANSGPTKNYKLLRKIAKKSGARFLYDANVGAALPILSSIRRLKRSGDQIVKIEGIFSGTLSYLFNTYDGTTSFSDLVKEAQKKGYTEPDPRDDLNGRDVHRKLLIAAREAGFKLEMEDIDLQLFLPKECFEAPTVAAFYEKLASVDDLLLKQQQEAKEAGKRLRFVATFESGKAAIALLAVGPDHPFFHLSGCDNIVSITSKYYKERPLVIQGPGAGGSLTASRLMEELVRLSK